MCSKHLISRFGRRSMLRTKQGYILSTVKHKLKPELAATATSEIRNLRLSGQEVTDRVETPMVAFSGDTTIDFIHEPAAADAMRAELLIVECSFIDDSVSVADARKRGHIHLYEIAAEAAAFQHVKGLLLIHFSCRFSNEEIEAALDKHLPPDLRVKCTPLLAGRERHR